MKLIVHNMLTSKFLKNVVTGFPLKLVATKTEVTQTEFDGEFVTRTMPRIDYNALRAAAAAVDKADALPDALPDDYADNEALMKQLHHLLMEIDVVEGELVCPETNRQFPISNGIPNMLAREDEVE